MTLPTYLPTYLPGLADPEVTEWAGVEYDADMIEEGLGRLLFQYKGKPRMEAVLTALLAQTLEAHRALWDLFTLTFDIDAAEGEQLDNLGRIVGEPRRDRADAAYRVRLRARIRTNRSEGRAADYFEILDLLFPGETVQMLDRFPCAIDLELDVSIGEYAAEVGSLIQDARPAAHQVAFGYMVGPPNETLTWEGDESSEYWGTTTDDTLGGEWAGVYG